MAAAGTTAGLLDGIRVVDFGQYIAAPGAGQNLADLGADVIKVEAPGGDQARSVGMFGDAMIRANNRGKRSLALDVRSPEGARVVTDLVASADVVLHNFRHGVSERLGVDASTLTRRHPRLVYGFVTGFGTRGPSRERIGLDIAAQAEFGVMSVTGEPDRQPLRVGFAIADVVAAQALSNGVLAALLRRSSTGAGAVVETSLMEAIVHAQASNWAEYGLTGRVPSRRGNGQALAAPAADVLATADGGWVVVSAYVDQKWRALCTTLGRTDLLTDPRFASNESRVAHREQLLTELGCEFERLNRDEAVALLTSAGVVCGAIRGFDEIGRDADLSASALIVAASGPAGAYDVPGLPFTLDGRRLATTEAAPAVGQHSQDILAELGRTPDDIADLLDRGVVVTTA
ncbi:CaiB/BaiF CoA transferase family protein [Janibacter sp. GS2]|uniref:CaiB/BaiF CoA transferase family protein n=1 Tax=Janibacter sp. GS2 TaxID=3442646 RepID=UPI003EBB32FB